MEMDIDKMILLVDSHFGVYTPQTFLERYEKYLLPSHGIAQADLNIVKNDIDHEMYWDIWADILDRCKIHYNHVTYVLVSNEDLWGIPEGMDIPEDWFI